MGATRVGRRRTMGRSRTSQRRWPGSPTSSGTTAAGGALPDIARPDRQRARRGDDCAVGSDRRLRGGHRCGKVRPLPALLRQQRPGLRPGRGHRLQARDERDLVLVGLRPRPAAHVRSWRPGGISCGCSAARAPTTSPGCGRSTPTCPAPGRSRSGGPAGDTSPGSASTAATTARPTASAASSARPSGAPAHQEAGAAVGECGRPGRRAGYQDRRDVHRDSAVADARARGDGRVYVKGYGGVSGAANENN
jgi:hypothetical protein